MILLLGGTGAARRLAEVLAPDFPLIASLSGATKSPKAYPCETRTGGFGGADAMADWLSQNNIAAIVDATHPYAAQISANAVSAAALANLPIVSVERDPWVPSAGDDWRAYPDLSAAVAALPSGARAFFATGRGGLETISNRRDVWSALRVVDDPKATFPGNGEFIIARPPFDVSAEKALFSLLKISHVVAKNAGGDAARTKIDAAGALGLPVMLIDRPAGPSAAALPAPQIPTWVKLQLNAHRAAKRLSDDASGA